MSATHEALCRVKVCPRPSDPWFHECEVCQSPAVHHHHRIPKGMGGSKARDVKENIVMLCARHHEEAHGIGASSDGGEGTRQARGDASIGAESVGAAVVATPLPPSPGASSSGGEDMPPFSVSSSPQDAGGASDGLEPTFDYCAPSAARHTVATTPSSVPSLESLE